MVYRKVPCKHWNTGEQSCNCKERKFLYIFQDISCPKVENWNSSCEHFVNSLGPRPTPPKGTGRRTVVL